MPQKPIAPGESEEYPVYEPEEPIEYEAEEIPTKPEPEPITPRKKELGIGEPVYLYIEVAPFTYEMVSQTFGSKIEANRHAEANYPNTKYKVYYESEAIAEAELQAKRQAQIQKAKETVKAGAKAVGREAVEVVKGIGKASYGIAHEAGMTREAMEAKEKEMYKEAKRRYREPPPSDRTKRPTFGFAPPPAEKRPPPSEERPFRPPSQERGGFRIQIPTEPYRPPHMRRRGEEPPKEKRRPKERPTKGKRGPREKRGSGIREPGRKAFTFNPNPEPVKLPKTFLPGQRRRD